MGNGPRLLRPQRCIGSVDGNDELITISGHFPVSGEIEASRAGDGMESCGYRVAA